MASKSSEEDIYEIESIVSSKRKGNKTYYLVKWQGFPSDQNTWEEESNIFAKDLIEEYQNRKAAERKSKGTSAEKTGLQTINKDKNSKRTKTKHKGDDIDEKLKSKQANIVVSSEVSEFDSVKKEDGKIKQNSTEKVANKSETTEKRFKKDLTQQSSKTEKKDIDSVTKDGKTDKKLDKEKCVAQLENLTTSYKDFLDSYTKVSTIENVTNEFDFLIDHVDEVWSCDDGLWARVLLKNNEFACFHCNFLHVKAPVKLLKYYESMIVFSVDNDEGTKN
ncbi:hypothetical protein EDEG_00207 [Edhazardia aedis USNM 41457]|uniref:Chromo domain-containing protein n=1 Tax=Edhazardia aedis (strain USNM 41457) TaxID=1003232 RepID=J9D6R7_EDHAE|nr:hypothetical protein EDEG_00207 [Edhazardia aedis USNM 41457]|eukprot:EJW03476.1 hypothetical protein EDEG_00207 [Edhazardia aedis USNM 41457]